MNDAGDACNRRILVVDDDKSIHEAFRKILSVRNCGEDRGREDESLSGQTTPEPKKARFEMDSAFQGQEALERVRKAVNDERPFAMAFIDMRMPPGWNGIETAARIRKVCPDLEIVICTAYSDDSWEAIAKKLGRKDHLLILKKPFDSVEAYRLAYELTEKWNLTHQAHTTTDESGEGALPADKMRVFIVDDDPAIITLFSKLLTTAGYDVNAYTDPTEAWNSLGTQEPLVLLTDWRMPGLSGVELCQRIRASDHLGRIYTILVTASENPDDLIVA
ncbi:MAG: response regulator, partial [Phycisphaerae bacterium]